MRKLSKSLILAGLSLMGSCIPTMATTANTTQNAADKNTTKVQKVKKSNHEINTDRAKYFFDPGYAVFNLAHSVTVYNNKSDELEKKDKNAYLANSIASTTATATCLALRPVSNSTCSNLLTGLGPIGVSIIGSLVTLKSGIKVSETLNDEDFKAEGVVPVEPAYVFGLCKYVVDIVNTVSRQIRINKEKESNN